MKGQLHSRQQSCSASFILRFLSCRSWRCRASSHRWRCLLWTLSPCRWRTICSTNAPFLAENYSVMNLILRSRVFCFVFFFYFWLTLTGLFDSVFARREGDSGGRHHPHGATNPTQPHHPAGPRLQPHPDGQHQGLIQLHAGLLWDDRCGEMSSLQTATLQTACVTLFCLSWSNVSPDWGEVPRLYKPDQLRSRFSSPQRTTYT